MTWCSCNKKKKTWCSDYYGRWFAKLIYYFCITRRRGIWLSL